MGRVRAVFVAKTQATSARKPSRRCCSCHVACKRMDMSAPIPLSSPDITHAEIDAVVEVMQTPTLSIGPKVELFERKCAKIAGRKHGIAVSSGTAGLHCVALACGLGEGDEVLTTPFSFVASTNCALCVGAKPKFVDIDSQTLNI